MTTQNLPLPFQMHLSSCKTDTTKLSNQMLAAPSSGSIPWHRKRRRRPPTSLLSLFQMEVASGTVTWKCFAWIFTLMTMLSFLSVCKAFNLDTRIPIVKVGGTLNDAYFGYSVAQHRTLRSKEYGESVILVGAPKDDNLQPNTHRSGALWQCPLTAAIDVSFPIFIITIDTILC